MSNNNNVTSLWGQQANRSVNPQALITAARLGAIKKLINDNFIVVETKSAPVLLRKRPDNLVEHTSVEALRAEASRLLTNVGDTVLAKKLQELVTTALYEAEKAKELPPSFTLGREISFARASLDLTREHCLVPTPTWDDFILRCGENGRSLMAFTYALLSGQPLEQYIYLYGRGGDGKGSYVRFLQRLMGEHAVTALDAGDKYWPAACLGKKLGVFNDLNNTTVVLSAAFKQITGSDSVSICNKYEKAFSARLDTAFILTSNKPPSVINSEAERRRAIICEVMPPSSQVPDYEEFLWAERQAFIAKCKKAFDFYWQASAPKRIWADYQAFEKEAACFEEANAVLFDRHFALDPSAYITAGDFYSICKNDLKNDQQILNFKDYLRRKGVERKYKSVGEKRVWVYSGIKLRHSDNLQTITGGAAWN